MGAPGNRSPNPMFCAGCMTPMAHPPRCANNACRWDETRQPEIQEHLPRHYLLLDRYYIGRVLGQGGFGITYLALDTELDRQLAIKEYLPRDHCSRLTDRVTVRSHGGDKAELFSNGLQGFLNEAKNIARLDGHPNIVSITDHVKGNGTAYMVMQFVPGKTLKQHLNEKGGRIPYTVARDIVLHVMSGLRKAHAHGVLHRDISPDNIMVSSDGPVKIIDFGAARQAIGEQARGLTVILKPGFAPEEQYRSRGKQGPWTDIYAVAATMYRCITGETPPDAPDRLAEDELVKPREFAPDLPPKVEAVILKGLAVKAVDRYQTIDEFQEALLSASGLRPNEDERELRQKKVQEEEKSRAREFEKVKDPQPKDAHHEPKDKKATGGTLAPMPTRPWFLSPATLAVFGVLLVAAAGLAFYLHSSTPPSAPAPIVTGPAVTPPQNVSGPATPEAPPSGAPGGAATVGNRDWSTVAWNDAALASCGNVQPCLDRKARADALLAVRDWKQVAKGPMLADCMNYSPCLKRAAFVSQGPHMSDEELGNYSVCNDSPNPARCLAYKKSEGIKDGPSR